MRPAVLLAGILPALVVLAAGDAPALCIAPETPCREFARTPFVFQGLVLRATETTHDDDLQGRILATLVRARVERSWKGLEGTTEVDLLTLGGRGLWVEDEFEFKVGERYIIWAWPSDAPSVLRTHACSLTRHVGDAGDVLEFLDGLTRPAEGGYVYGRLLRDDSPASEGPRGEGGVTVVLEGAGSRRETRTAGDGRFRFRQLPAGRYEVFLDLPATLAAYRSQPADPHLTRAEAPTRDSVTIDGPRDCAKVAFHVQASGRMWGLVRTHDGKAAAGVVVQAALLRHLSEADRARLEGRFSFLWAAAAVTNDAGWFELLNVAPGRYVVGVALDHRVGAENPYPRTFFPGVNSLDETSPIDLQLGQRLDLGTLVLPRPLEPFTVQGLVVGEGGHPVADAWVRARNAQNAHVASARTNGSGRFSLTLLHGSTYLLTAGATLGDVELVGGARCGPNPGDAQPVSVRIELRPRPPRRR